jgi:hypothetical protein
MELVDWDEVGSTVNIWSQAHFSVYPNEIYAFIFHHQSVHVVLVTRFGILLETIC